MKIKCNVIYSSLKDYIPLDWECLLNIHTKVNNGPALPQIFLKTDQIELKLLKCKSKTIHKLFLNLCI